ncbi:MAG TPA: NAD-dependent epimerase/dehydratase family protein [Thermoplasmata archaeon]|nr:NAD-dependent epimerase/dehydratase family protein [Thermoplasmata archaeon]
MYAGRTVLVTGAAGFLGSHLVERLVSLGARVVAVDSAPMPPDWASGPANDGSVRYERADVEDVSRLETLVRDERPDVVFHLAAIASPRACAKDFATAFRVNVGGTQRVLEASRAVGHFVLLSSAAVYGAPVVLPMAEDHPLLGRDPYAITKIMAELLVENAVVNDGRRASIVRNFNAFGPRQPTEYVIPSVIRQALTTGRIELWSGAPVRDLMFVDNTEEAILAIGARSDGGTFNVGSGRGMRMADLAQRIAATVGRDVPIADLGKPVTGSPALVADVRRLRALGWEETVPFDEGLARTVAWYRR